MRLGPWISVAAAAAGAAYAAPVREQHAFQLELEKTTPYDSATWWPSFRRDRVLQRT